MDIYKIAAQSKMRFPSVRGDLTVEQLFDLPLKGAGEFDLDHVARGINGRLKTLSSESFVDDVSTDPNKGRLEVMLEIVKDVIKTKKEELDAKIKRLQKAEQRVKILDAINAKQDAALTAASMDELKKKLEELDN